jgi:hypothetical protein
MEIERRQLLDRVQQLIKRAEAAETLLLKIEVTLWDREEAKDIQDLIHNYFKRD